MKDYRASAERDHLAAADLTKPRFEALECAVQIQTDPVAVTCVLSQLDASAQWQGRFLSACYVHQWLSVLAISHEHAMPMYSDE